MMNKEELDELLTAIAGISSKFMIGTFGLTLVIDVSWLFVLIIWFMMIVAVGKSYLDGYHEGFDDGISQIF